MDDTQILPVRLPEVRASKLKVILGIIAFIFLIFLYVYLSNPLIVTVEGVGQVDSTPDSATVAFVVLSQKATSKDAREDVEAKAKTLENALYSFGAGNGDIARSQVSVTPSGLSDSSKAYSATISMGGKVTNIDAVGGLVSFLYSSGAYYVSQPVLSSSNAKKITSEAYNKALDDATSQINDIAWKNKKLFRKKVSITKYSVGDTANVTKNTAAKDSAESQTPSNAFTTTQVVTVVYKMW